MMKVSTGGVWYLSLLVLVRGCPPSVLAFAPLSFSSCVHNMGKELPPTCQNKPLFISQGVKKEKRNAVLTTQSTSTPMGESTNDKTVVDYLLDKSDDDDAKNRKSLKLSLLKMAASYDRGFGATPSSRLEVDRIINSLEALNPTTDASRGISGEYEESTSPLKGNWRMIWTTAQDVLSLASSPIWTVGAIYQIINPPIATNIIDFIPRSQALLPPGMAPSSITRAEVTTRASQRVGYPLRVGLVFEKVQLVPVELLGLSVKGVLPPLGWNLPRVDANLVAGLVGSNSDSSGSAPGYFDVAYLDDELLIIKQNAPGGLFALIKVDNYDP